MKLASDTYAEPMALGDDDSADCGVTRVQMKPGQLPKAKL